MIQEWQQASSGVLSLKYGREQRPCSQVRRGNRTFSTTASPQHRMRTTMTTSLIITRPGTSGRAFLCPDGEIYAFTFWGRMKTDDRSWGPFSKELVYVQISCHCLVMSGHKSTTSSFSWTSLRPREAPDGWCPQIWLFEAPKSSNLCPQIWLFEDDLGSSVRKFGYLTNKI